MENGKYIKVWKKIPESNCILNSQVKKDVINSDFSHFSKALKDNKCVEAGKLDGIAESTPVAGHHKEPWSYTMGTIVASVNWPMRVNYS